MGGTASTLVERLWCGLGGTASTLVERLLCGLARRRMQGFHTEQRALATRAIAHLAKYLDPT